MSKIYLCEIFDLKDIVEIDKGEDKIFKVEDFYNECIKPLKENNK